MPPVVAIQGFVKNARSARPRKTAMNVTSRQARATHLETVSCHAAYAFSWSGVRNTLIGHPPCPVVA